MTPEELYGYLVTGKEFVNEDVQSMYDNFIRAWKKHICRAVDDVLKEIEKQQIDAKVFFNTELPFAIIRELENFTNPNEREIFWGFFVYKITEILTSQLKVEIVYKVSL